MTAAYVEDYGVPRGGWGKPARADARVGQGIQEIEEECLAYRNAPTGT